MTKKKSAPKLLKTANTIRGSKAHRRWDMGVVGDICVDLVLTGDVHPQFHQVEQILSDCSLELGGSATIFASQVAKVGGKICVVGWTGPDSFGEFVRAQLKDAGVDTSLLRRHAQIKTGVSVALAEEHDRAILTYLGTIDATRSEDLGDSLLLKCRHWHVASYFLLRELRPNWPAWLAKCKLRGLTTSLDTNWDPENKWEGVLELLPHLDVFLPNSAEALAITGERDVQKAGESLAKLGPLVVIKMGAEGALTFANGQTYRLNPDKSTGLPIAIKDSIGAGDNFDAGFLRSWLLGNSIEDSMRWGHRCAVASLECHGGTKGQLRAAIRKGKTVGS